MWIGSTPTQLGVPSCTTCLHQMHCPMHCACPPPPSGTPGAPGWSRTAWPGRGGPPTAGSAPPSARAPPGEGQASAQAGRSGVRSCQTSTQLRATRTAGLRNRSRPPARPPWAHTLLRSCISHLSSVFMANLWSLPCRATRSTRPTSPAPSCLTRLQVRRSRAVVLAAHSTSLHTSHQRLAGCTPGQYCSGWVPSQRGAGARAARAACRSDLKCARRSLPSRFCASSSACTARSLALWGLRRMGPLPRPAHGLEPQPMDCSALLISVAACTCRQGRGSRVPGGRVSKQAGRQAGRQGCHQVARGRTKWLAGGLRAVHTHMGPACRRHADGSDWPARQQQARPRCPHLCALFGAAVLCAAGLGGPGGHIAALQLGSHIHLRAPAPQQPRSHAQACQAPLSGGPARLGATSTAHAAQHAAGPLCRPPPGRPRRSGWCRHGRAWEPA